MTAGSCKPCRHSVDEKFFLCYYYYYKCYDYICPEIPSSSSSSSPSSVMPCRTQEQAVGITGSPRVDLDRRAVD